MASKRTYPQAVALTKSSGKSVSNIEQEPGITTGLLAKWKQRLKADGEQAFPGKRRLKEDDELIRRSQFYSYRPNQKWVVDITAIASDEGVPGGVLDLFSRRVVGWAMDDHMPDELTQAALTMAIQQRQPPAKLLHHSDQGSQYTSDEYQALLTKYHMVASLSGVGCCYDNAPMESFWGTLKIELVYRQRYQTRAEGKNAIFAYIEGWYNRQRRHSSFGYLSPEQFEHQFAS